MIAVAFALPAESANFTKLLDREAINASAVRVIHTGVGESASRRSMQQFLAAQSPRLLISAGFAGALTNDLSVADLLLAQNFTSPQWFERSCRALAQDARVGILATAPAITDAPGDRSDLARRTSAIAVDMETEFIAEACRAASIPLIALRVISDTPAQPMPAPPRVLFDIAAQKTKPAVLALHVAKHPASLLRLIAFARRIARARQRLTWALATLVQDPDVSATP